MKKVTVIGGGTGTFVVLSGLKNHRIDLGVIVSMMDSGGSTGRLRDQLGVLPPGDLRQALLALSDAPLLWRRLFLYRFQNGDLGGHNFGNLFLSALEKVSSNYNEVINTASYVLKTKGKVIPVTFERTHLGVEYESGSVVKGEGNIDKNYQEKTRVKRAFLEPAVVANSQAIKHILESDYIITGPGDLYASIIPILLVDGIKDALKRTKATCIYILNLMTKSGQTTDYTAYDHLKDVSHYFGKTPDYVIVNNGSIPEDILRWYEKEHEHVVVNDLSSKNYKGRVIISDVVDRKKFVQEGSDTLVDPMVRSILRHSSKKLEKVLLKIIT
jgi:uncharacterized cofD-like protein